MWICGLSCKVFAGACGKFLGVREIFSRKKLLIDYKRNTYLDKNLFQSQWDFTCMDEIKEMTNKKYPFRTQTGGEKTPVSLLFSHCRIIEFPLKKTYCYSAYWKIETFYSVWWIYIILDGFTLQMTDYDYEIKFQVKKESILKHWYIDLFSVIFPYCTWRGCDGNILRLFPLILDTVNTSALVYPFVTSERLQM